MRSLLVSLTLLSACAQVDPHSSATTAETPESSRMEQSEALATYVAAGVRSGIPQPTFHTARMAGKLTVQNGCVGLVTGSTFTTLAFSQGEAAWDRQRRALVVRGSTYDVGTSLELGGSSSGGPAVQGLSPDIPERCRSNPIWYVAPGSVGASVQ